MGQYAEDFDRWCQYSDDSDDEHNPVTCKHCGERRLWWFPEKRGKYRLMNSDGTHHNCQRVPANPDEFPTTED